MYRITAILFAGLAILWTGCASGPGANHVVPKLKAISVGPADAQVPMGQTQQFSATGEYSDGTTQILTSTVTWHSSNTNVGAVSTTGLLSPVAEGMAKITATSSGVSGSTTVSVTAAAIVSLSIVRSSASIPFGTEEQFTAIATFTDQTTQNVTSSVTWASSQPGVASVNSTGIVTGISAGTTMVTASSGSISASASLTVTNVTIVSLALTPTNSSVPLGVVRQFVATGTFSDGSTQDISLSATWSSTDTAVALVQADGVVEATGLGTTTISASFQTTSNSTGLTVTSPQLLSIAVQPANPSLALGTSVQLSAIGTYDNGSTQSLTSSAAWSSSATAVATVAAGLVKSQSAGSTTISATVGSVTGSTSLNVSTATLVQISVTPATPAIAIGATKSFSATGSFSDGTTENLTSQVTWSSSDTGVASMSGSVATGIAAGTSTITGSLTINGSTVSGYTTLTITDASLQSLTVSPTAATILVGGTQTFTLTGRYSDGTTKNLSDSATWTSSDSAIAAVNPAGVATGIQGGACVISAVYGSFPPVAGNLTVSGGTLTTISVAPATATIAPQTTQQFAATGLYSDGTTRNLTAFASWTSSDYAIATISVASSSQGLATAIAPGNVVIGALIGSVIGSAGLTVSNTTLKSISVSPADPLIALGTNQNFNAIGTFSDGTIQNISRSVTWSSSSPAIATINSLGTATSVATGTTTITATMNGISGETTLTVQ